MLDHWIRWLSSEPGISQGPESVPPFMDTISALLNEGDPVVAIIGATDNPRKYGNRIYLDLKGKGFRVYPVNPSRAAVDGDPAYVSISDLPETPDIIKFVVPPSRTLRILEQAKELGLTTVWIQPGAEDDDVMSYLDEHGFDYVTNDCIMVRTETPPAMVGRRIVDAGSDGAP